MAAASERLAVSPAADGAGAPGLPGLRALLVFSVVASVVHYAHNALAIEHYPHPGWISTGATRATIVVSWPLLTAAGLLGYRQYARRK